MAGKGLVMHPFSQSTAAAALANLESACEAIDAALRARTYGGMVTLLVRASANAINAKAKLADALSLEEMAVTTGEEAAE